MKNVLKLMAAVAVFMTYISCENDATNATQLTSNDAIVNSKIDLASDDIATIADQLFDDINSNTITYRTIDNNLSIFSNCATITRSPAFGTVITPGTQVTKTIDFGTSNCALDNGNTVRGKIIISFVYQPSATSHTITYTFDNFHHNDIKFVGTKTFTRVMTTNAAGFVRPVITMVMDMTVTFPNGDVYTRVGTRTREIVEGYTTPSWTDNIYQITGNS
jgi:hypothetical protein